MNKQTQTDSDDIETLTDAARALLAATADVAGEIYSFDRNDMPIFAGQQMDVFIDAPENSTPQ